MSPKREHETEPLAVDVVYGGLTRDQFVKRAAAIGVSASALGALLKPTLAAAAERHVDDDEINRAVSGTITVVANVGAGAENDAWNARTKAFMEKFPNVHVKPQLGVGETFYALLPKVETMIAGGTAPDVIRVGNYSTALFGARNALVPLDSMIKQDASLNWTDFIPRARKAMTVNGKVYALPENGEAYGIHYNKTEFKKKGLPDPRTQWEQGTWTKDAFLKAAQALTEGSGANQKFGFLYETWNSENWIFFNGGKVVSDDAKSVLVDKPAAYNGLQFAADLTNKYKVAPNAVALAGRPPTELFMNGTTRMYMVGGWYIANFASGIKGFEYGTTGPPLLSGGKTSKLEISGYAITSQSKNKQAAWEYAKFITGPIGQDIWSIVGTPTRSSVLTRFLAGKTAGGKYASYYKPFVSLLPNVEWTPFITKSPEIEQDLTTATDPVWLGQKTAQAACLTLAKQLRSLLA